MNRSFTEAQKKIVAARQKWTCAGCDEMLDSTYQIDHIVPLWKNGPDCYVTNAQALCPRCHAKKTQNEGIERVLLNRKAREECIQREIKKAPAPPAEKSAPTFEFQELPGSILECLACGRKYSTFWKYHMCEKRKTRENPFLSFLHISPLKLN